MEEFRKTLIVLSKSKSIVGLGLFLGVILILAYFGKLDREASSVLEVLSGAFFVSRGIDNYSTAKHSSTKVNVTETE